MSSPILYPKDKHSPIATVQHKEPLYVTKNIIYIFSCRPNFVVDGSNLEPWSEDTWTGDVKIGEAELVYNKPCTRCQSTRVSKTSFVGLRCVFREMCLSPPVWPPGWPRQWGSVQGWTAVNFASLVQTACQVLFRQDAKYSLFFAVNVIFFDVIANIQVTHCIASSGGWCTYLWDALQSCQARICLTWR